MAKRRRTSCCSREVKRLRSNARPNGNELFAKLPAEIRMRIREHLFYSESPIKPLQSLPWSNQFRASTSYGVYTDLGRTLGAFLRTCKLFYTDHETYPTFYEINTFAFEWESEFITYIAAITPSRREALRSLKISYRSFLSTPKGWVLSEFAQGTLSLCKNVREVQLCDKSRTSPLTGVQWINRMLQLFIYPLPALEKIKVWRDYCFYKTWEVRLSKTTLDFTFTEGSMQTHSLPDFSERDVKLQLRKSWMALRQERAQPARSKIKAKIQDEFARAPLHIFGEGRCGPDRKPQFLSSRTRRRSAMALTNRGTPKSVHRKPERLLYYRGQLVDYRLARDGTLELKMFPLIGFNRFYLNRQSRRRSASWKDVKTVLLPGAPDADTYRAALWLCSAFGRVLSQRQKRMPLKRPPPRLPSPWHLSEAIKDLAWENRGREARVLEKVGKLEEQWNLLYQNS